MWRNWRNKWPISAHGYSRGLVLAFAMLTACNNYGLKDKLENPGSGLSTTVGKYYAFVTTQATDGSMAGLTNGSCAANGLLRADCVCTDLARANNLTRNSGSQFVAWLSAGANDMTCRITGTTSPLVGCPLPTGGPTWHNTLDEVIAVGFSDLFDGTLSAQLKYTAQKSIAAQTSVWSGTGAGGDVQASNNCTNWSDGTSTPTAVIGTIGALGALWTNGGSNTCINSHHIYCFAMP